MAASALHQLLEACLFPVGHCLALIAQAVSVIEEVPHDSRKGKTAWTSFHWHMSSPTLLDLLQEADALVP